MDLRVWVRKYGQLYYGWKVLAASTVMALLACGVFMHGFNFFILPIQKELALSSAQIALIFSISRAEGGAEGPFAGWLIDRFGSRRLLIWGVLLSAAGFFLLSRVNSLWGFALVYLGVVSLGATVGYMHALLTNVNMWFVRHRAMAMSIFSSGFTMGGCHPGAADDPNRVANRLEGGGHHRRSTIPGSSVTSGFGSSPFT